MGRGGGSWAGRHLPRRHPGTGAGGGARPHSKVLWEEATDRGPLRRGRRGCSFAGGGGSDRRVGRGIASSRGARRSTLRTSPERPHCKGARLRRQRPGVGGNRGPGRDTASGGG